MGKSCTCCGTKCRECICERFIESLEFDFYNKNGYLHSATIPVNSIVKNACLKYFYIGDATGYYRKDGTRVAYKRYRMEISPTPGTSFTFSLLPCKNKSDIYNVGLSELITSSQLINGKIIIDFPDERFYGNLLYGLVVSFNYDNNPLAFFSFDPWDAQGFQQQLRNYENIDPSLIGVYPELKQCTVNLVAHDLLPGNSLNLSPCSGDLICQGTTEETRVYDFEHYRQICQCQNNSQLDIRERKIIREFITSGVSFDYNIGNYKKTYHGFLLVLKGDENLTCDIYANISDSLTLNSNLKPLILTYTTITTDAGCEFSNALCNAAETTLGLNCQAFELVQRIPASIGSFSKVPVGDLDVLCSKSCFPCSSLSNPYPFLNPTGKPKSFINQNIYKSSSPSYLPTLTVRNLSPELLWDAGSCCCSAREKSITNPSITGLEIMTKLAFFDVAYTTFPDTCTDLSIVNYAEVKLDLKELNSGGAASHNPVYTEFPTTGRCLSTFPGDIISYILDDPKIPRIRGFDLSLGDNIGQYYNLKVIEDIDTIPDAFTGTRSQFIFSNTIQEVGIRSCYNDDLFNLANYIFKDDRVNKFMNFHFFFANNTDSFGSNGISFFNSSILPRAFNIKRSKLISSEICESLATDLFVPCKYIDYEDMTYNFAEFIEDPLILLDNKFEHDLDIGLELKFETNLRYETQVPYLDKGSGLKMSAILNIGNYIIKSNTLNLLNTNDFFQELIFDTSDIGIYDGGSISGATFIPDPAFYKKILKVRLI